MKFEHRSRVQRKQETFLASGGGSGQDTVVRRTLKPAPLYKTARLTTPRFTGSDPDAKLFLDAMSDRS